MDSTEQHNSYIFGALLLNLEKAMQIAELKCIFRKWAWVINNKKNNYFICYF